MATYLKYFEIEQQYESWSSSDEYVTPNVSFIVETESVIYSKPADVYHPIPTNQIHYKAGHKLTEVSETRNSNSPAPKSSGLHVNSFDSASIVSHEFNDGIGIITFDTDLTTIGWGAFYSCDINEIIIPSTVEYIYEYAFEDNNLLKSIICYATLVPSTHKFTFNNVSNEGVIYCPIGSDYSFWLNNLDSGWIIQEMNIE